MLALHLKLGLKLFDYYSELSTMVNRSVVILCEGGILVLNINKYRTILLTALSKIGSNYQKLMSNLPSQCCAINSTKQ
jgi:hypothetical protein